MAKRAYCKNTVRGKQRGKKYPAELRAEVIFAMIGSNSICAVARKYGVPESTIRSWMAQEAKDPHGAFAAARAEAAREIAARAALGARAQVGYLQQRVAENQRAADIMGKLEKRLDEDARARCYEVGTLLKSEDEALQDAAETGLVVRSAPGSYDRALDDRERNELERQLERYGGQVMTDRDAANIAGVLMQVAETAASIAPVQDTEDDREELPVIQIGADIGAAEEKEIVLER